MPARYYGPAQGRFINSDSAGLQDGMNAFAYCGNDLIDYTEPVPHTKEVEGVLPGLQTVLDVK